ncbi:hypothetical protein JCM3765_003236 [Sporobolomyces pararoseus]
MPPRKSTRVVKKTKKVQDDDSDYASEAELAEEQEEEEEDDDFDEETGPSKKKPKSKTTAKKKKSSSASGAANKGSKKKTRSRLEVFNKMPLDVLIEIMRQVDLKTLLAMSRTCSIFRQVLHSEGGKSAWRSARHNTGIRDLKRNDLTEWELAQLLFDGTCVDCGKTRAVTVDYALGVRGCANCMRAKSKRREMLNESSYHKLAFDVVPSSLWSPYFDATPMEFFWIPTLRRVTEYLNSLKDKPEELKAFVKSRKHIKKQARDDKRMLEQWERTHKNAEKEAKEDKRTVRFDNIKERLRLEGYDEQDLASRNLAVHPDVNNARELTDNVWKRIKPILTKLLDEERNLRLANEALQRQKARAFALKYFYQQIETSLPPSSTSNLRTFYPPFANFLSLPSVKPLYVPEGYVPTPEDLASAKPQILVEIQQFSAQLQDAFLSNLLSAYTSLDPQFDVKSLSTTSCTSAIQCPSGRWCKTYSTFPSILDHARLCCGDTSVITQDSLSTSPLQIQIIRQMIEAVNSAPDSSSQEGERGGKLSENSSVAELYALGNNFECQSCEFKKGQTSAAIGVATWSSAHKTKELNWSTLLTHIKSQHTEGGVSIKFTTPVIEPADPQSLKKEDDDGGEIEGGGFIRAEE